MIKLIPAAMSAKLTLRKRNKKFNQARKDAIAVKKYQEYSFAYLTISWGDAS